MSQSSYVHDNFVPLESLNEKRIQCTDIDYSAYISSFQWNPINIINPVHYCVYFLELELVGYVTTKSAPLWPSITCISAVLFLN